MTATDSPFHAARTPLALRAFVAVLAAALVAFALPAAAQDGELEAEGRKAAEAWVGAVVSGEVDRIAAVLAPEFQIVRADGTAYDRESYLASNLPQFPDPPEIRTVVATSHGDLLVVRYILTTGGILGDEVEQPEAPRLTVFRKDGDTWLVVSHANFAAIQR